MTRFLNTSKAYAEIEDIVNKAKSKLVLISPYIKIPEPLLERLKHADGKGIKITLVCRKADLKSDVESDLKQLENLELRFLENLHAKCFYNEESMVIASLNLHEHSQQHNREMGVLLTLKDDQSVFSEARDEAEFIVGLATEDKSRRPRIGRQVSDTESRDKGYSSETKQGGFCIRCRSPIPYSLDRPYCRECYGEWSKWQNLDYEESYCHTCGTPEPTTILKPQCYSCYTGSQR